MRFLHEVPKRKWNKKRGESKHIYRGFPGSNVSLCVHLFELLCTLQSAVFSWLAHWGGQREDDADYILERILVFANSSHLSLNLRL